MTVGTLVIIIMGMIFLVFCGIVFVDISWCGIIGLIFNAFGIIVLTFLFSFLVTCITGILVTWLWKHWNDKLFDKNKNKKEEEIIL